MSTSTDSGFSAAGLVAVVAGLTGVVLLAIAAVRVVDIAQTADETISTPTTATTATAATTGPGAPSTTLSAADVDPIYVLVTDDSDSISVAVPADWADVSGAEWVVDDRVVGSTVTAATDIDAWYTSWGTPGAFVGVSPSGFSTDFGDFSGICTAESLEERAGGVLSGTVQSWSDCGAGRSDFYVFIGGPPDAAYTVLMQVVSIDGSGSAMVDRLLATFSYRA